MGREIMITDADTTVEVVEGDCDNDPVRVKFGPEPYAITMVGDLSQIHRVIVEADRQVSGLVVRSNDSPAR